jgi:hypothetical protein
MKRFGENMKEKKIKVYDSFEQFAPECYKVQLSPSFSTTVLFTLHPGDWDSCKSLSHGFFLEAFKRLAKKKKAK